MQAPAEGFKSFTEDNFRENLGRLTGQLPADAHAHHVFPLKFADKFHQAGLNIHDPRFGTWWERSSHLKNATSYNNRWTEFFRSGLVPHLRKSCSSEGIWHANMDFKSTTKAFPGFDRLFWLTESGGSRAFRARMDIQFEDVALTRAEVRPERPIQTHWAMGSTQPVEVIWTTHAIPIIVSDAVVQLLRSHGFTGWSLYGVTVHDKKDELIPGYHGLAITGRCGEIDWSKGIEEPRLRPAGVFPVWRGLFFDPASWDGSDLFMPANTAHVCVVEAVKKAFKKAKVRNVVFEALDQFERSWDL